MPRRTFIRNVGLAVGALGLGPLIGITEGEATTLTTMPLVIGPQVRDGDPARTPWPPNVIATLQELFPTGQTLVHPNVIDHALATGKPFQLRLVDANYTPGGSVPTPKWVLDACGSVKVTNHQSNLTITMARVWRSEYQNIRTTMLATLAAAYDGKVPLIFDSWGMAVYPEPFMRYLDDGPTRANLKAAGYTADQDKASHLAGLQAHGVFKSTRVGFALNPYQVPKADWSGFSQDLGFVDEFCLQARTLLGNRACLGNNSIRSSYVGKDKSGFYAILKKYGKPSRYQTATKERVGDLKATIDWAISLGAYAIELPQGYGSLVTDAYLAAAKVKMAANA